VGRARRHAVHPQCVQDRAILIDKRAARTDACAH
jgi:hypothetical protein